MGKLPPAPIKPNRQNPSGHGKTSVSSKADAESRAAGATEKPSKAEFQGKVLEFLWWMKKQGYANPAIEGRVKLLKRLVKLGANLYDPESVKEVIARQSWSDSRKELAVEAYSSFLEMYGGRWDPPRYRRIEKLPWIPTETEIDQLIAGCGSKIGAFLRLIKETGMRPGEALRLKWIDIDSVLNFGKFNVFGALCVFEVTLTCISACWKRLFLPSPAYLFGGCDVADCEMPELC